MYDNILKNKKYYKYALFALIIVTLLSVMPMNLMVRAAEEDPKSIVNIFFKEGNAGVSPVDPEDPDTETNGGTGDSGPLALNKVSPLFFDEQFLSAYREEYPTVTKKPFIQVTDLRGNGKGWAVNARASKFTSGGVETLFGSTITLKNGAFVTKTQGITSPRAMDPVVINTDDYTISKVVIADPHTGMGTWLTKWYTVPNAETNDSVILEVPAGAGMVGTNEATITWFLIDDPAAD